MTAAAKECLDLHFTLSIDDNTIEVGESLIPRISPSTTKILQNHIREREASYDASYLGYPLKDKITIVIDLLWEKDKIIESEPENKRLDTVRLALAVVIAVGGIFGTAALILTGFSSIAIGVSTVAIISPLILCLYNLHRHTQLPKLEKTIAEQKKEIEENCSEAAKFYRHKLALEIGEEIEEDLEKILEEQEQKKYTNALLELQTAFKYYRNL